VRLRKHDDGRVELTLRRPMHDVRQAKEPCQTVEDRRPVLLIVGKSVRCSTSEGLEPPVKLAWLNSTRVSEPSEASLKVTTW
jgi:hypothetical protein